jgi:hypothetical protein
MRSGKLTAPAVVLEADVDDGTFRSPRGEQPEEKTDAPDITDAPARRRNSLRFMVSPPMRDFANISVYLFNHSITSLMAAQDILSRLNF